MCSCTGSNGLTVAEWMAGRACSDCLPMREQTVNALTKQTCTSMSPLASTHLSGCKAYKALPGGPLLRLP